MFASFPWLFANAEIINPSIMLKVIFQHNYLTPSLRNTGHWGVATPFSNSYLSIRS